MFETWFVQHIRDMRQKTKKEKLFNPFYAFIPILLGVAVIAYLFKQEFDPELFSTLKPNARMWGGILLAVFFMVNQNLAMTQRFKIIVGDKLSWLQVFRVNLLCEFTSAVTPSAVGGSSLIAVYLHKEGLKGGESTTIMIVNLFLDELFLTLICLATVLIFPAEVLFTNGTAFDTGVRVVFLSVLTAIAAWTLILYIALFHRAVWVKKMLIGLFSLPLLRRWKGKVEKLGDDLIESSHEISKRTPSFWLKCMAATAWGWCSRYLVVNALLLGFSQGGDHLLAFARQLVIWMTLVISPTPGGSGFGEYMFNVYYADFFPIAGTALIVAFIWRLITYYSYLIAGFSILPGWVNNNFRKEKQSTTSKS